MTWGLNLRNSDSVRHSSRKSVRPFQLSSHTACKNSDWKPRGWSRCQIYNFAVGLTPDIGIAESKLVRIDPIGGPSHNVPDVNANPATHTIDTTKPYSGSAIIDGNTSGATYSVPTQPSCGNVEMAADGTYTFTANSTMSGDCTFTYQVCSTTDTTDCTTADITLSGTGLAFTGFRSSSTLLVASFFVVAGGAFMMAASRYRRRLRA